MLVAIIGSTTPPGRLRRAVAEALDRATVPTSLIDLAEQRIAFADGRPPAELGDDTADVVAAIAEADAVLLATPTYRGSMTGALKNLLDTCPSRPCVTPRSASPRSARATTTSSASTAICATC